MKYWANKRCKRW